EEGLRRECEEPEEPVTGRAEGQLVQVRAQPRVDLKATEAGPRIDPERREGEAGNRPRHTERVQTELHFGGADALRKAIRVEVGVEERPRGTELEAGVKARRRKGRRAAESQRGRADEIRHLVGNGVSDDGYGVDPARRVVGRPDDVEGVAVAREEHPAEVRGNAERRPRRRSRRERAARPDSLDLKARDAERARRR